MQSSRWHLKLLQRLQSLPLSSCVLCRGLGRRKTKALQVLCGTASKSRRLLWMHVQRPCDLQMFAASLAIGCRRSLASTLSVVKHQRRHTKKNIQERKHTKHATSARCSGDIGSWYFEAFGLGPCGSCEAAEKALKSADSTHQSLKVQACHVTECRMRPSCALWRFLSFLRCPVVKVRDAMSQRCTCQEAR